MNSTGHFVVSIIKSIIRIVSCIISIKFSSITLLAIGILIAEILGILEECLDKR